MLKRSTKIWNESHTIGTVCKYKFITQKESKVHTKSICHNQTKTSKQIMIIKKQIKNNFFHF